MVGVSLASLCISSLAGMHAPKVERLDFACAKEEKNGEEEISDSLF